MLREQQVRCSVGYTRIMRPVAGGNCTSWYHAASFLPNSIGVDEPGAHNAFQPTPS